MSLLSLAQMIRVKFMTSTGEVKMNAESEIFLGGRAVNCVVCLLFEVT